MKYEINSSKYYGIEPEPVNPELIKMDMMMQEGYGHEMDGDSNKAVSCWKGVFDELTTYFEENHLSDLKSFDDIFNGTQYVQNWVQDYDDALRNSLLNADEESKEKIGKLKTALLNFLLGLNLKDELNIHYYKRSLAETYYLLGQPEVGEQHFNQLIDDYPDNVWGYIGYSDKYWMDYSKHEDFDKAFSILNRAYHRLSIKESDIIAERLTDLMIAMKKKELEAFLEFEKENAVTEGTSVADAINYLKRDSEEIPFSYLKFLEDNKAVAKEEILKEMKSNISDERPIIPEYAVLYQKLFNAREEKLRKPREKVVANYGFNQKPIVKEKKIGRNEPCPCGSGKKYKKCCGK